MDPADSIYSDMRQLLRRFTSTVFLLPTRVEYAAHTVTSRIPGTDVGGRRGACHCCAPSSRWQEVGGNGDDSLRLSQLWILHRRWCRCMLCATTDHHCLHSCVWHLWTICEYAFPVRLTKWTIIQRLCFLSQPHSNLIILLWLMGWAARWGVSGNN